MDALSIIKRFEAMEASRSTWESMWQDCADYGMPSNSQITRKTSPGQPRTDHLFDSTAEDSNIQLAAGIYAYMFPSEGRSFALKVDNEELNDNDEVKQWLDKTTKIIHEHLIQSNFRPAFFEFLLSLGCFGTACLYEAKGKKTPLHFTCHHLSTIYACENSDGKIDTVFRPFEFTARQAVQEFGEENVSDAIKSAIEDEKTIDKKFKFLHAVYPREDRYIDKEGPTNMPYVSVYIDVKEKMVVKESGYEEFPFQVDRFYRDTNEVYGRSPMMKKLPDIKMLNRMKKTRIKAWEKMCDPPIVLPNDGSISQVATQPGGVIYKMPGSDPPEWFRFQGDLTRMEEAITSVKTDIMKGFYLDMFDPLIDRQNMTATEVMARVEQKMRFLTPIIGRLQSELFNPLIHRVIGILGRQGLLPDMPAELAEVEYGITYLGRLALAIKTLESEGLQKTMIDWAPLVEVTGVLDNLDIDTAFRDSARNNGMPSTWLKDKEQMQMEREAQQQAQQQAQMAESLPKLAKGVKDISGKVEEGSIAEGIMNGIG